MTFSNRFYGVPLTEHIKNVNLSALYGTEQTKYPGRCASGLDESDRLNVVHGVRDNSKKAHLVQEGHISLFATSGMWHMFVRGLDVLYD